MDLLEKAAQLLTAAERERAGGFRFERHRRRFVMRRAMRRVLLAHLVGVAPSELAVEDPRAGKPFLRDANIEFNASHSGDLAVIVTGPTSLGVDVESLERPVDYLRFARHCFTEEEYADIERYRGDDLRLAFFNCWTGKEAYIKAIGLGLGKDLRSFAVNCAPGGLPGLRWDASEADARSRWQFLRVRNGNTIATALVSAEPDPPQWRFRAISPESVRVPELLEETQETTWLGS
jgi:4'-phosphopantetheinyl transferase